MLRRRFREINQIDYRGGGGYKVQHVGVYKVQQLFSVFFPLLIQAFWSKKVNSAYAFFAETRHYKVSLFFRAAKVGLYKVSLFFSAREMGGYKVQQFSNFPESGWL